ncbi:hypothetical protein COHA_001948 [Chlorella ohadii]|uniref:Uncharacterized protein n=1 Tax=Chlorella ohadii TaxID=2649997 RepID=A0AAD5H512_9CHLO|nr:hypothetical protein COHA_001948 [Chlorella ohadii]
MPSASGAPARSVGGSDGFNPADIAELRDSKQELILKVQSMKKELADWRVRMNERVEGYRTDLTTLQATLTSEMGGLRSELADVKARIRAQLEANGEAIANLHARGDPGTRAELEGAAVAAVAAAGKARA